MKWNAKWIWHPERKTLPNTMMNFRKSFDIDSEVKEARAFISADSRYRLYVNGKYVLRGPAAFGPLHMYYDVIDIAPYLRHGRNTIAILGYYIGISTNNYIRPQDISTTAAVIFQCSVGYESGKTVEIVSDGTWKAKRSKAWRNRTNDSAFAIPQWNETFDARKYEEKWTEADFDDSAWKGARELAISPDKPTICAVRDDLNKDDPTVRAYYDEMQARTSFTERPIDLLKEEKVYPTAVKAAGRIRWNTEPDDFFEHYEDNAFTIVEANELNVDIDSYLKDQNRDQNRDQYRDQNRGLDQGSNQGLNKDLTLEANPGESVFVVFDFGENVVGRPFFAVEAEEGAIIEINAAETAEKLFITPEERLKPWSRYICRNGLQEFELNDYFVFRYLQVMVRNTEARNIEARNTEGRNTEARNTEARNTEGRNTEARNIEARNIEARNIEARNTEARNIEARNTEGRNPIRLKTVGTVKQGYPYKLIGSFDCSDKEITHMWDIGVNTVRLMSQDIYICETRERQQYAGEETYGMLAIYYSFGGYKYARKYLQVLGDSQHPTGLLLGCWPSGDRISRIKEAVIGYVYWKPHMMQISLRWVIAVWDYYLHSGDRELLSAMYPKIQRLRERCGTLKNAGSSLIDSAWDVDIWMDHVGFEHRNGLFMSVNCLYYGALKTIGIMAGELGDTEYNDSINRELEEIRKELTDRFWSDTEKVFTYNNPDTGKTCINSMTNAIALYYGIVPEQHAKSTAERIYEDKTLVTPTPPISHHTYLASMEYDNGIYFLNDLKNKWAKQPSVIENKTFPELFDEDEVDYPTSRSYNGSLCPTYILSGEILGVKPIECGFRRFVVAPKPGWLEWAKGDVPTPHGIISVEWKIQDGEIDIKVGVPEEYRLEKEYGTGTDRKLIYCLK